MSTASEVTAVEAVAALAAVEAGLPTTVTGSRQERLAVEAAVESLTRRLQGLSMRVLAEMETEFDDTLGGRKVADAVADELRLTPAQARARVRLAAMVTDRTSTSGEPLGPEWPNLAKLVHAGIIGDAHLTVAQEFLKHLPAKIDAETRGLCEVQLAEWAAQFRPDEMQKLAVRLLATVHPDGDLEDERDRARKRHFTMGRQGADKMTSGRFCLDPSAAAHIEALLAKFARPGVCDPDATVPIVDGEPDADARRADGRSHGQRCHDAIAMLARNALTDERIGQHRGLPVTVIVTADVKDLDDDAAHARTAGGTLVPMRDFRKLGQHATNYLALFDRTKPLRLWHGRDRRLASGAQRLMLIASERGCTFPGCGSGAYYCQVHHANGDWQDGGRTDIDDLTLACERDHPLAGRGPNQWKTAKRHGITTWTPPKAWTRSNDRGSTDSTTPNATCPEPAAAETRRTRSRHDRSFCTAASGGFTTRRHRQMWRALSRGPDH